MEINLWILVDNQGRIYYTASDRKQVEEYNNLLDRKDLKIVELKGE